MTEEEYEKLIEILCVENNCFHYRATGDIYCICCIYVSCHELPSDTVQAMKEFEEENQKKLT